MATSRAEDGPRTPARAGRQRAPRAARRDPLRGPSRA